METILRLHYYLYSTYLTKTLVARRSYVIYMLVATFMDFVARVT